MQKGQALVTLLFFVVIALSVTSAGVVVVVNSIQGSSKLESGTNAYMIAESGVENAILRLLRNSKYCGEVLPVDSGNATISVVDNNNGCTGASPFTITVVGKTGNYSRTIQVQVIYTLSTMSISSWKEI